MPFCNKIFSTDDDGTVAAHAPSHTDGTDDIQDATASQKGVATAAQITKLDGIEAGAQVNTYWKSITEFNNQPASTSTITMTADKTASINPGDGLKYRLSGTDYYGKVNTITSILLTVDGIPLTTGVGDLEGLWVTKIPVIQKEFGITGEFSAVSEANMLRDYLLIPGGWRWKAGKSKLVGLDIACNEDDLTTQATIQATVNGNNVLTTALTLPDAGNETKTTVNISSTYYSVTNGDILELSLTASSGGAVDLFATFMLVPEME